MPLSIQRPTARLISLIIGSTKPTRHSNRALPDDQAAARSMENTEIVTTRTEGRRDGSTTGINAATPSVVREWVDELSGRNSEAMIRVPSDAEITQLMGMFPHLQRSVVERILQRR